MPATTGGLFVLSALFAALAVSAGCARVDYRPEPLDPERTRASLEARTIDDPGFREYVTRLTDDAPPVPGRSWDLRLLTLAAFYHNPRLEVAHQQLRLSQARIKTASQRINPRLNMPLEYSTDTHEDSSHFIFGWLLDFVYEREGKREARIHRARSETEAARLHITEVAWDIRSRLFEAYLDHYSSLQSLNLGKSRHELLQRKLRILQQRLKAGIVGGMAVGAAEIELQQSELSLSNLEAEAISSLHSLAGVTGLQAEDLAGIEFEFGVFEDISGITARGRDDFRKQALLQRADIRRTLAEYQALEHALKLEIEKQYPDITLSPGFVFDQDDKIWALGSAWMLPMFHNNDGPIAEALAERSIKQSRFLELQAGILNSLEAAFGRFDSLKGNLELARSIRDKAEERSEAVANQYDQGYSDRLAKVEAKLALVESRRSLLASKTALLQAVIRLESITQAPIQPAIDVDKSLDTLYSVNTLSEIY